MVDRFIQSRLKYSKTVLREKYCYLNSRKEIMAKILIIEDEIEMANGLKDNFEFEGVQFHGGVSLRM